MTSGTSVFYWWENVSGRCLPCSRCPADQVTIKVLMLVLMLSGINMMLTRSDHIWCPADHVTIKVLVLDVLIVMLIGINLMVTRSHHIWRPTDQVTIKVRVFFIVNWCGS